MCATCAGCLNSFVKTSVKRFWNGRLNVDGSIDGDWKPEMLRMLLSIKCICQNYYSSILRFE